MTRTATSPAGATSGPEYADPLAGANVTPERIDMGVDYAGTGTLSAIARGIITEISPGGWGSYGNYIAYKITDPRSTINGKTIYYAEGVTPVSGLKIGQAVNPGQAIAKLIPGWHSGIEIGFGSNQPDTTYAAAYGGGYTEGEATRSGIAFSNLLKQLGAPGGKIEGPVGGTAPTFGAAPTKKSSSGGGSPIGSILDPLGNLAGDLIGGLAGGSPADVKAAKGLASSSGTTVDVIGALANFVSNPVPALLTMALVLGGALMVYEGAGRMLGFGAPVKSTAQRAAVVIAK